jgi:signal transduction histidine kinase/ligand-binding sensor domain-containing protein
MSRSTTPVREPPFELRSSPTNFASAEVSPGKREEASLGKPIEARHNRIASRTKSAPVLCLCVISSLLLRSQAHALDPTPRISQYGHTAWRIEDGFFAGAPNAIAQSTDGYLWIGTQAGLMRFDGVRFVSWKPPKGTDLPSSRINSLLGAQDGSLWIGTTMGLARWRNGELINYTDPRGSIMAILEDPAGTIWIARANVSDAEGPLCAVKDKGLRCYGRDNGIAFPYLVTLADDTAGNIWVGAGTMVSHWKISSADTYVSPGLNSSEVFNGVAALAGKLDGSVWVGLMHSGKGGGLQQLAHGYWKPFVVPGFDGSTLEVFALLTDRDGSLWVGTLNRGVYRIQGDKVDHFGASDGLSGNAVSSLFQDREGNIWIATSGGIDSFHGLRVVSFSTRQGLSVDQANSVLASHDGTVWIGNYNLDVLRSGKITSIQPYNGLPGGQVTSLLEDRAGRVWVGVDLELAVYIFGRFGKIHTRDDLPLGAVRAMAEDVGGSIWVLTTPMLSRAPTQYRLFCIQDLRIREEISSPQLPPTNTLATDPNGGVWLGLMNGGVARYRNGQIESFFFRQAPDESMVHGLLVNSDASVLAATSSGLVGWRNGRMQTLTVRNGLPCDVVYSLIFDAKATLWLYTACGLVGIPHAELQGWWESPNATVKSRLLDLFDGAQPMSTPFRPNASRSPDGRLWFANQNVVQMIDPSHLDSNPIPPPVHIERLTADGQEIEDDHLVSLPPRVRNVHFAYTALSLVAPRKVRFRYQLEGYDASWSPPVSMREVNYTNLPPGNYEFRVIACNNDGVWNNEGAHLDFSIAPAYYQTLWFKILLAITTGGLLWTLYFLRLKQATANVQGRLLALMEERERIARELHDTLLQGFQGITLRMQGVSKNIPVQDPLREMMEEVLDRADEVLREARQRVRNLRRHTTDKNELRHRLTKCGEELSKDHAATFTLAIIGEPRVLESTVQDEAYRIVGEALTNAFRHASATKIETEVTYDSSTLRIRVRDDGVGIDKAVRSNGHPGHWGLTGMRERAEAIRAVLNIWSRESAGTEVELVIPASIVYPRDKTKAN